MAVVPSPFKSRKPNTTSTRPGPGRLPVEDAIEYCRVFDNGTAIPEKYAPTRAQEIVERMDNGFVWVGMHEPDEHQMTVLAEKFNIHELIVEDAVQAHQRPKLERYDDQLFIVARTVKYRDHDEVADKRQIISTGEVQMILGENFIITIRHGSNVPDLAECLSDEQELVAEGPEALAWKVLDILVDRYGEICDLLAVEVDELEEMVFTPGSTFEIDRIYMFKREILEMRHAIAPLAQALGNMITNHKDLISKKIRSYLRDVNDHELLVKDHVSSFDERLSSLIDASVAKVTMQQNADMRTISAVVGMWAAPTLVAGIYGMNFDVMPELHWTLGYPMSILIMVAVVVVLFLWFKKNRWL